MNLKPGVVVKALNDSTQEAKASPVDRGRAARVTKKNICLAKPKKAGRRLEPSQTLDSFTSWHNENANEKMQMVIDKFPPS